MPCPTTGHACLKCTSTPAALEARRQLGPAYFTLHASAAKPRYLDIAATAHQIRLKASRSQHGQQLHGQAYQDTLTLLRGHSRATVCICSHDTGHMREASSPQTVLAGLMRL